MKAFLRFFFRLLYHQFAFTYDLVAATVSMGKWRNWVMSVIPFIEGERVLEIGHGPGHLQRDLLRRGLVAVGIDESPQMGRLARRNLRRTVKRSFANREIPVVDYTKFNLTRGIAQRLPFAPGSFDNIVATFPSEYITDPETLAEIKRCLADGGKLVVLPVALPRNTLLDWLFKATHQRPTEALEVIRSRLGEPFVDAGFRTEIKTLDVKSGMLLMVLAAKPRATLGAISPIPPA